MVHITEKGEITTKLSTKNDDTFIKLVANDYTMMTTLLRYAYKPESGESSYIDAEGYPTFYAYKNKNNQAKVSVTLYMDSFTIYPKKRTAKNISVVKDEQVNYL